MRAVAQHIYKKSYYSKAIEWGKLITLTGSAQLLVQITGFLSGILVIRLLPTHEYALYTLANTMLGTMTILADGGISAGVMAQGGKVWQNPQQLGIVINTGLELRRKFAIGSLAIAVPLLLYLLRHHQASWLMAALITASLIPAFLSALSGTLLETALKLRQDIAPLQKNHIQVNLGRLALIGLTMFAFPWAFVAVLAAGVPQIWANLKLRRLSARYADLGQEPDPATRKEILTFVSRILPGSIYYCLSGQLTLWLISSFGTTEAVAQVGAMSRLSLVLVVVRVLFSTLTFPRFARLQQNARLLFSRYVQLQLMVTLLSTMILSVVWLFPSEVLWILGKNYTNLQDEVFLQMTGSCLGLISTISYGLYTSRGWAINPFLSIPLNVLSLVAGAFLFDVASLHGILLFNIFVAFVQVLINTVFSILKISQANPT
ncbi:MATE family efflux transporter [Rufibacter hautae]|uniref:Polysaccharide biosynthesis protein n=1 Tax=Rufibacter hautae TaxID=2595005 RepID=A0A5B6TG26_9BACT|nr:polysaccharide biosynthesis protein [Rufibacter hautae]KAA3439592.1 polysaccharide biosynthesis protein [Rufibacter hautae]